MDQALAKSIGMFSPRKIPIAYWQKTLKLPAFCADTGIVPTFLQRFDSGLGIFSRRKEPRYEASGRAQVYENGHKGSYIGAASLRNISASGVCIAMPQRLLPGVRVHLAGPGLGIDAIVRHCVAGSSGYVIGLEVTACETSIQGDPSALPATW